MIFDVFCNPVELVGSGFSRTESMLVRWNDLVLADVIFQKTLNDFFEDFRDTREETDGSI